MMTDSMLPLFFFSSLHVEKITETSLVPRPLHVFQHTQKKSEINAWLILVT